MLLCKKRDCGSVVQQFLLTIPAVQLTDLLTDLLRRMLGSKLSHSFEVNLTACRAHIQQEVFCKSTILDIGQDLLHGLLGLSSNNLRSGDVIAVLSSVGDGISHSCETRLIDQIYDQLHLVDTLEVCVSRIVTSLNQESQNQPASELQTPPQRTACSPNRSVSVSVRKVVSRRPALAPPIAKTVSQCQIFCFSGVILLYSNQAGSSLASLILDFLRYGPEPSVRSW